MKYPLQVTIVTLAVFAFMALIIMDGTVTYGTPERPSHFIHIKALDVQCGVAELQKSRPASATLAAHMTTKLRALCDDRAACDIDTAALYDTGETLNNCTDEMHLTYACSPDAKAKEVFLYEGQRGTLQCDVSTNVE